MSQNELPFLCALRAGCQLCEIRPGPLLIAVSGGADSTALLRGLLALQAELGCDLHVAHLDHGLRGTESAADAAWVAELCRSFSVECHTAMTDVRTDPSVRKLGLEGAARTIRRAFLRGIARQIDAQAIATAHTFDDQAETVLHHLLRGTGLTGLAAMQHRTARDLNVRQTDEVPFIRPMLQIDRASVEAYLRDLPQDYRIDSTNSDVSLTRNRLRHELLPQLEQHYNPEIRLALVRLSVQARDAQRLIEENARDILATALVDRCPTVCRLDISGWERLDPHLLREVLVLLWKMQNWPRRRMGFLQWELLRELTVQKAGSVNLPGNLRAERRGHLLVVTCLNPAS